MEGHGTKGIQVILNADDFGRSAAINAAVMLAHRKGVLTSASLMVAGDAVDEAVELARQTPTLAVGLHIVLANGPAVLPAADIPHLVDASGRFPDESVRLGLLYLAHPGARRELERELAAQFDRFAATGLRLSHVDSHLHMHMHPTVLGSVLSLAEQYGAYGFRVPRDDLWLGLKYDRTMIGAKILWTFAFRLLSRWGRRYLRACVLSIPDRVYGLVQSGQMREPYVVRVLQNLCVPTAELYFHPSTVARSETLGPNVGDLRTLLSPAVRQVIREQGLCLISHAQRGWTEGVSC